MVFFTFFCSTGVPISPWSLVSWHAKLNTLPSLALRGLGAGVKRQPSQSPETYLEPSKRHSKPQSVWYVHSSTDTAFKFEKPPRQPFYTNFWDPLKIIIFWIWPCRCLCYLMFTIKLWIQEISRIPGFRTPSCYNQVPNCLVYLFFSTFIRRLRSTFSSQCWRTTVL